MPRLTKSVVEGLRATTSDIIVWDSWMPRFGVRVYPASRRHPHGKKVYLIQYRTREGRTRRVKVGDHGPTMTAEQARKLATAKLAEVDAGKDPAEERDALRHGITVAELCDQWLERGWDKPGKHGGRPLKPSSRATYASAIEKHIKPLLGGRKVCALAERDVTKLRDDVAAGKTAHVEVELSWSEAAGGTRVRRTRMVRTPWSKAPPGERTRPGRVAAHALAEARLPPDASKASAKVRGKPAGGKGISSRVVTYFSKIIGFAMDEEHVKSNCAKGTRIYSTRKVERYLSPDELARLAKALQKEHEDGTNAFIIAALWVLMLSGRRKSEVLGLRWDEVDEQQFALRLKDTKAGPATVPLTQAVYAVLLSIPRTGSPFVFPSPKSATGRLRGIGHVWDRVRAKAGIEDVRLHDLRHTQASVGAADGLSLQLIGSVLGHRSTATTERYVHLAIAPQRAAAETIVGKILPHTGRWSFDRQGEAARSHAGELARERALAMLARISFYGMTAGNDNRGDGGGGHGFGA